MYWFIIFKNKSGHQGVLNLLKTTIKINLLNHDNPSIILGNQKWNGTEPIFINIAEFIIIDNKSSKKKKFIKNKFNKIENKKLIEAIDLYNIYFYFLLFLTFQLFYFYNKI